MIDHTCDRTLDESGDEPITCIYPTCSVCGKPQVFAKLRTVDAKARFGGDPLVEKRL